MAGDRSWDGWLEHEPTKDGGWGKWPKLAHQEISPRRIALNSYGSLYNEKMSNMLSRYGFILGMGLAVNNQSPLIFSNSLLLYHKGKGGLGFDARYEREHSNKTGVFVKAADYTCFDEQSGCDVQPKETWPPEGWHKIGGCNLKRIPSCFRGIHPFTEAVFPSSSIIPPNCELYPYYSDDDK